MWSSRGGGKGFFDVERMRSIVWCQHRKNSKNLAPLKDGWAGGAGGGWGRRGYRGVGPSWMRNWREFRLNTGSFFGLKSMFLGSKRVV